MRETVEKTAREEAAGYTRSYRRRWQHPAFRNLRDAAIWSWMTDAAAWRDTAVNFDGKVVRLKRGQLVTSERFIAHGFCVGREVVRRVLNKLVSESMIVRAATHGGTIVTICNYDTYQPGRDAATPPDQPRGTQQESAGNPNKKEDKENKKYKFLGTSIRLTEGDYERWRKSFHAIADFDAELTRIDAQVEGRGWFAAAASKLNYKHQELLRAKAAATEAAPGASNGSVSLDRLATTIKRAYAEKNQIWVSRVSIVDARKVFDAGLITADEAAMCGVKPAEVSARETPPPDPAPETSRSGRAA